MPLLPRPEIQGMAASTHGGVDYVEAEAFGIAPQDILDFSANLNPFGPPQRVVAELCKSKTELSREISNYPDSEAISLRGSLAQKLGVKPQNILVTSGTTELIRLAALAYFGKEDAVLIVEPTFGEYQAACQLTGASVIKQQLSSRNNFWLNTDETAELVRQYSPKGVFICNPNNPTGRYLPQVDFERIMDISRDSLVILDEAYVGFVDDPWCSLDMIRRGSLLILRSMTKDYALAGLRLGYGVAREEIIATLRRVCPPWNVSTLAQRAGVIAINEEGYLRQCQIELKKARNHLSVELSRLGLSPLPSEANFFLVEVGNATEFRRKLFERGILVRDCTSFGLPQHIRIAPRTLAECRKLVAAIEEIVSKEQRKRRRKSSIKRQGG